MRGFGCLLLITLSVNWSIASPQPRGRGKLFLGSRGMGLPTMPNIDYALRGYHLLIGNPLSTGHEADPGFSHAIFQPNYSGYVSGDLRYQIPDGFQAYQKPICNIDFTSKSYGNEKKYQDEIKVNVDVTFGGWGAAFTANPEYKKNTESMVKAQDQFIKTEALCGVYEVVLDIYKPPNITEGFANALRTLVDGNYQDYLQFVTVYGTHFLTTTHMGAKYTEQMEMSKESKDTLEREGVDVGVAGSYSTIYNLKMKVETSYNQENVERFNKEVTSRSIISYGSRPPTNGSAITWTNKAFEEPLPISYGLLRIQDLFNDRIMGHLGIDYKAIGDKLEKFLEGYCENEKTALGLKDCNGPSGGCSGGNQCHHNAFCKDVEYVQDNQTVTSYECSCKENYVGDGFQCSGWNITTVLSHDLYDQTEGPGDWADVSMCPHKTYAYAYSLKIEERQGIKDDTGLNGVKLYCKSFDGSITGEVTSGVGNWGSWKSVKSCQNDNKFLDGFRFRSEGPIDDDSTWGDDVDVRCGGGEIIRGEGSDWGSWSSWTFCPVHYNFCGLQTKIHEPQGFWKDDCGLNDLRFVCCKE